MSYSHNPTTYTPCLSNHEIMMEIMAEIMEFPGYIFCKATASCGQVQLTFHLPDPKWILEAVYVSLSPDNIDKTYPSITTGRRWAAHQPHPTKERTGQDWLEILLLSKFKGTLPRLCACIATQFRTLQT